MITIVTVNWNAYDFLDLLIESVHLFTAVPYEIIVIDNSEQRKQVSQPHVHQFFMPLNVGHGKGLNEGCAKAYELFPLNPFMMFLDCDCHILRHQWDADLISKMKALDFVAGRGVPSKPIRPACIFMRAELAPYDWAETQGYRGNRVTPGGYDVAIKAYYKIMADNFRIGFLESKKNRYGTLNGEEWHVKDLPTIYHHWHGSHLKERQEDFPNADLQKDKELLMSKIPWRLP